jgi:HD-like signal output (HDOD) protein/ActR/RegA family two-component response regulator
MSPMNGQIRALVVDDEEPVRDLVKKSLGLHGIECDFASDGNEALSLLESRHYDLAVTDLRMPNRHGHSLCTFLLQREDRPLIVVLTGVMVPRLADDLKARGVEKVYFKPMDFREFADEVHRLIIDHQKSNPAAHRREKSRTAALPSNVSKTAARPENRRTDPASSDQLVAVLRKTRTQSAKLADKLVSLGISAVSLDSTDALRGIFLTNRISLLVIDQDLDGFFSGFEVIRKLRAQSIPVPVVVVSSKAPPVDESSELGLTTHIDSAANNEEIAESVRRFLQRRDECDFIPDRARELAARQGDLPVLPHSVVQLLQYLQLPPEEVPLNNLCQDVILDPKASAVLLRAVNASTNGISREISNVNDAVRVLGVRSTVSRILNAALVEGIGSIANSVPPELLAWHTRRTMLIASTASTFAKGHGSGAEEMAFLLGIIQEVGILCFLQACPAEYEAVLARWRSVGHAKLSAVEMSHFGCTHAAVSAAMADRWQLPRSIVRPVLNHLEPIESAAKLGLDAGLHLSTSIAEALVDATDAPHPTRHRHLDRLLARHGSATKATALHSLSTATLRAAQAFQHLTVAVPTAADLEKMVTSALSETLLRESDTVAHFGK